MFPDPRVPILILTETMTDRQRILDEARNARCQAAELVAALTEAKAMSAVPGVKDLYKRVTGQSSLDNAIASARRTLETFERVLAEMGDVATPVVSPVIATPRVRAPMTFAAGYIGQPA